MNDSYQLLSNRDTAFGGQLDDSSFDQRDGKAKPKVLVVDDEELIPESIAEILRGEGFAAVVAYNGNEALEIAQDICPAIVIPDVLMPGIDGIETAIALQRQCPDTRILLFSGQA